MIGPRRPEIMVETDNDLFDALICEVKHQKDLAAHYRAMVDAWASKNTELRGKLASLGHPEEPFDDGAHS